MNPRKGILLVYSSLIQQYFMKWAENSHEFPTRTILQNPDNCRCGVIFNVGILGFDCMRGGIPAKKTNSIGLDFFKRIHFILHLNQNRIIAVRFTGFVLDSIICRYTKQWHKAVKTKWQQQDLIQSNEVLMEKWITSNKSLQWTVDKILIG